MTGVSYPWNWYVKLCMAIARSNKLATLTVYLKNTIPAIAKKRQKERQTPYLYKTNSKAIPKVHESYCFYKHIENNGTYTALNKI